METISYPVAIERKYTLTKAKELYQIRRDPELAHPYEQSHLAKLTGKVARQILDPSIASASLISHLKIGEKIIKHVESIVTIPGNYACKNCSIRRAYREHNPALTKPFVDHINQSMLTLVSIPYNTPAYNRYIKGSHVANCLGMCTIALEYLEGTPMTIECFFIEFGDHAFNVLGRDPSSNPSDHTTWGPSAVVVDSWAGSYFPAIKIETFLRDSLSNTSNGFFPYVVPVDFSRKRLKLLGHSVATLKTQLATYSL